MVQDIIDVKRQNDEQPSPVQKSKKPKLNIQKKFMVPLLAVLLVALAATSVYFYTQYQDLKKDPKSAQTEKNKAETQRVLDKLKAAILITETDAPTVARVEDPEKLKSSNKDFYKDIQKGDYLIIFPKRAMVYRESNNQIINIAPIINTADLQKKQEETQGTTQPAATTPRR